MPQGKGTYGSKVGRPKKQKKALSQLLKKAKKDTSNSKPESLFKKAAKKAVNEIRRKETLQRMNAQKRSKKIY